MKKKILFLLLFLTLSFTACSDNEPTTPENKLLDEGSATEVEEMENAIQNEINNIAEQYEPQNTTNSLHDLCKQLEDNNLVNGEYIEMAGEMVGAISGIKYADCNVEIYEYDTNSEKYAEIVNTGKTTLEGFNIDFVPSAINGKYIIYCDESENKNEIIDFFSTITY